MNNNVFNKILIANRGEIALRIIIAVQNAGMKAISIHSEADSEMPYVMQADESWTLGEGSLLETYLNQELIIKIAERSGASAIHPGYGFLAENAAFASLCKKHEIVFIGPSPEVINLMGNKSNARNTATKHGVPVLDGLTGSKQMIMEQADTLQFPVLIKPAAGGGGKGMHVVHSNDELKHAIDDATREANNYFGSDELYVEKFIENARHIEVQVLADHHGNVVHLFERECSLQRRYQKIIEEAPSPSVSPQTREKITQSAVNLVRGIGYTNAGTIEYLMDDHQQFYFIEMNTRIQVEHPVTEMITGVDIVKEQLRIAAGEKLSFSQDTIKINGHSIEARLYAENPAKEFMPASGKIRKIHTDKVTVRLDGGYREGNVITPYYDPLITKLISHGTDRKEAIRHLVTGLKNFHLSGVTTNRDFLVTLLLSNKVTKNQIHTRLIDQELGDFLGMLDKHKEASDLKLILSFFTAIAIHHDYSEGAPKNTWENIGFWRQEPDIQIYFRDQLYRLPFRISEKGKSMEIRFDDKVTDVELLDHSDNFYKLMIDGQQFLSWADVDGADIILDVDQFTFHAQRMDIPDERYIGTTGEKVPDEDIKEIHAPLNGKIVKINIKESEKVKTGDTMMVIESMKMENRIISPRDSGIGKIHVNMGELVEANKLLITLN